jgi:hypothetical protein
MRCESGRLELALAERELPELEIVDGDLVGRHARVESRCVLVQSEQGHGLVGVPMPPIELVGGALCFDPRAGGVPIRHNSVAGGAYNDDVAEAARFGMVNTLFHLERAARYLNELLRELGAAELPPVHAIVSAHCGSRLPGYASMDGDFREGKLYPFQGGHYRLSQRETDIPEPEPVRPDGEIHLGPGFRRAPFAGVRHYLRTASHNPATIYHEYGHHLCRHTADFCLNGERAPSSQRNGNSGPEEGICNYLVAALLGTSRPYGWNQPRRGPRRDHDAAPPPQDAETDPDVSGAWWARAWWRCRKVLLDAGSIPSGRDHDRMIVQGLLELGRLAALPDDGHGRRDRSALRSSPAAVSAAYMGTLIERAGGRAAARAGEVLRLHGLLGEQPPAGDRAS